MNIGPNECKYLSPALHHTIVYYVRLHIGGGVGAHQCAIPPALIWVISRKAAILHFHQGSWHGSPCARDPTLLDSRDAAHNVVCVSYVTEQYAENNPKYTF